MSKRTRMINRRAELKLNQEDVADKVPISRTYYVNIENGIKTPSLSVAKSIADVLKTTVDDIFFGNDVPKGNKSA